MGIEKRSLKGGESSSETMETEFDDAFSDSDTESDSDSSESGSDTGENNENEKEEEEDDDDDEVVKAIKLEKRKKRNCPPNIVITDHITDICFHPANDILGISNDVGDVLLYKYSDEECVLLKTLELHTKPTRDIEFNIDGDLLLSTGKDKSIMVADVETGKLKTFYENAHDDAIYSLKVICENRFVTGDDSGVLRMWDLRTKKDPIFDFKLGEEYISDMVTTESKQYLACAGGDGALSSVNLNARKIHVQSEEYDSELTCLGVFRGETRLLAGSSKGKMYVFNWGEFGLHSDEYTGCKKPISCMVPITENIVVTSGEDGVLRAAHMFPHRQLGIVGHHTLPVEILDINHDGHLIASSTFEDNVKFWNIEYFEHIEEVINVEQRQNKRRDMKKNLPSSKFTNASDFFSGLA